MINTWEFEVFAAIKNVVKVHNIVLSRAKSTDKETLRVKELDAKDNMPANSEDLYLEL